MPPTRRQRNSIPQSPGADDISSLTLEECRDRLARNERVLNSSLFNNSSPMSSLSTSPTSSFLNGSGSGFNANGIPSPVAGPSRPPPPPRDPVKEKLLSTRQALLAREQELILVGNTEQIGKLAVGSPTSPNLLDSMNAARRISAGSVNGAIGPNRSGKARALEIMRQNDALRDPNSIIISVDHSRQLAERDFDNQTAENFSSLSIKQPSSSTSSSSKYKSYPQDTPTKPGRSRGPIDPLDEIARGEHLGRLNAFMSYKDPDFDDEDDGDVDLGFEFDNPDADGEEGEYADERIGSGLVDGYGVKRERGTGEEIDELGEDEERWMEGNDEYEGMGGVGPGVGGGLERVR